MKRRWKLLLVAGVAALLVASVSGVALAAGPQWKASGEAGNASAQTRAVQDGSCIDTAAVTPLSEYEEETLLFMLEEEKLARDVYTALYAKWEVAQFSNIAASESRHMASIEKLVDRYDLVELDTLDTPGVFANDDLQALYDDLVARGTRSLEEAFQVGVDIEELDIDDLEDLIGQTSHADITRVMQNLLRGSQNHLRAFTASLNN
jgi:hypothetical protein